MEEEVKENAMTEAELTVATRDSMVTILSNIGCQPIINENGSLSVSYDGDEFYMEFCRNFVYIWEHTYTTIKEDDPTIPDILEAINLTNNKFAPTIVLNSPDEYGLRHLYSIYSFRHHPACPDNADYMIFVLDLFHNMKVRLQENYHKIADMHNQSQK